MSTNLRGKDDKLNYIVGSFVTSGIFHVWQKHTFSSCMFALALSAASCIVKDSRQNNWTLLELPPTPAKATYFYKDWTLLKDPRPWKN
ncbi:hypothetical protein KM043_011288 [Ampulex compressa]|nr:hypothetical protein KM043_011288 [Ampulex compressa]